MLTERNGFYAFESALHVFPSQSNGSEIGLEDWNRSTLWRDEYDGLAEGCLFFAEDVFGTQFCITKDQICIFDPETGSLEFLANTIEEWAEIVLSDFKVLTGYPLAHEWQIHHGRIPNGKRLVPKTPFVAGGKFDIENLYLCDAVESMKFRAKIAKQIKDLPDGSRITFRLHE
ncbi:MAG: SMI1/KNR4 family protein [Pyrinomonadaceae bacterium]